MSGSESVGEGRRLALLGKLGEVLGREESETLMDSLPPVPWESLATKGDLRASEERLRIEMNARFQDVDARFDKMDSRFERVDSGFEALLEEMKAMERRLTLQMAQLSRTLVFTIIGFSLATLGVVLAVGFG